MTELNDNPDTVWLDYDSTRVCKILEHGKLVVVKPKDYIPTPLFCSECLYPIKTLEDVLALREFSCCAQCKLYFASKRPTEWKEQGWRMNKHSEEWESFLQLRQLRAKTIITFK